MSKVRVQTYLAHLTLPGPTRIYYKIVGFGYYYYYSVNGRCWVPIIFDHLTWPGPMQKYIKKSSLASTVVNGEGSGSNKFSPFDLSRLNANICIYIHIKIPL